MNVSILTRITMYSKIYRRTFKQSLWSPFFAALLIRYSSITGLQMIKVL